MNQADVGMANTPNVRHFSHEVVFDSQSNIEGRISASLNFSEMKVKSLSPNVAVTPVVSALVSMFVSRLIKYLSQIGRTLTMA